MTNIYYNYNLFKYTSTQKTEDEHVKKIKQKSDPVYQSKVYCPHAYLILNFQETLSQREKVNIRK